MNNIDVKTIEADYLSPGISEEARLAEMAFSRGEGSRLYDVNGKAYLDFSAGIFTQNIGHGHPYLVDRLKKQIDQLWNVHDCSHPARAELCLNLSECFPDDLQRFAFFSTGAEAVEAAIRAVLAAASPKRQRMAALRYGFHGKTQGARSLVHWDIGFSAFSGNSVLGYSANCYRCPLGRTYPSCDMQCAMLVAKHIATKDNISALFFEPVQGAAGVIVPPKEYWEIIQRECHQNGVLMVADEIVTAGGRSGYFLACEYYGLKPDLVTAAKGLSSGFPFSVLAGKESLMAEGAFAAPGASSSTYGGNPLSCTAASATLNVLRQENVIADVTRKGKILGDGLKQLAQDHAVIGDVRGLGLLWALEFVSDPVTKSANSEFAKAFYVRALDLGARVCLGGNVVRIGPPLNVDDSDIRAALAIFDQVLSELHAARIAA
jgi:4-aminobutyrate aminotransferase-like enzyme